MNKAILDGLTAKNFIHPSHIGLYTLNTDTLKYYQSKGFTVFDSSKELSKNSEIVLIGVKPQNIDEVIAEIKDFKGTLVSIAAGISIKYLNNYFKHVIRVMPNLPLKLSLGAIAISHSHDINEEHLNFVTTLFKQLGTVKIIDDALMNEIITVNGSTPAYVYYFIDCLINDATKRGIDYDTAKELLIETFIGASTLLKKSSQAIEENLNEVCSKNGTTIEAINAFKEQKLDEIIHLANEKCIAKAKVIGK